MAPSPPPEVASLQCKCLRREAPFNDSSAARSCLVPRCPHPTSLPLPLPRPSTPVPPLCQDHATYCSARSWAGGQCLVFSKIDPPLLSADGGGSRTNHAQQAAWGDDKKQDGFTAHPRERAHSLHFTSFHFIFHHKTLQRGSAALTLSAPASVTLLHPAMLMTGRPRNVRGFEPRARNPVLSVGIRRIED